MKFTNIVVALCAAATVYSKASFNSKADLLKHLKENNPDCAAELSKYQVCIINPSTKKDCSAVSGSDCSNFYADPKKYVGHCIGNKKIDLFSDKKLSEIKSEYKQLCKKIENKDKTTTIKKTSTKVQVTSVTAANNQQATTKTVAPAASSAASSAPAATSAAASATSAAAPSASSAAASTESSAPATTNSSTSVPVSGADAAANGAANGTAPATNGVAPAANNSTATGGQVSNVITGNNTAPATTNNNNQVTSDAAKLTVSLFVTMALVMLSFY